MKLMVARTLTLESASHSRFDYRELSQEDSEVEIRIDLGKGKRRSINDKATPLMQVAQQISNE
jgi:hypothetical protein